MKIVEFLWPDDRVEHIAEHNVEPHEVEEVCGGNPLVLRTKSEGTQALHTMAKMTHQPIPQTDSIEELAHFGDTHDVTDYEDELEEVTDVVFDLGGESVVSIPLQPADIEAIRTIARERGVSSAALLRDWVLEKLGTS